jgi:hypothetical protein
MRKKIVSAAFALALGAASAQAASLDPPVLAPQVVIEEAEAHSAGIWVPLALFAIMAAVLVKSPTQAAVSDARLKSDIVRVGATESGLPLYQFRYTGLPTVFEGVMAQDVLMRHPDAIVPLPLGFMAVDYDKLGLSLRVVG